MMAQLIDRKHLKQEMKELLRSAQVSPRGMTCLYLALVLVLNLADSFMGLMNPGLLGTFISILTRPDEHGPGLRLRDVLHGHPAGASGRNT